MTKSYPKVRNPAFFQWVADCCDLLGRSIEDGEAMMPHNDPCWYFCYDDGMTPAGAVAEAIRKGAVIAPVVN